MLNKKTVLIFADKERALTATAVKEQILEALPLSVVIDIDSLELHADALRDFVENAFKLKVNLDKNRAMRAEKRLARKIDETPKSTNEFKNRLSYKKMENIFNRYTPDLVVTIGYGAFSEAIAVRDKLSSTAKVFAVIDEYALNRQLINTYADGYIVENMAIKTTLVNSYIKENKVILADIPVGKSFVEALNQKEARRELRVNTGIPTLLVIGAGQGSYAANYNALKEHKEKFNVLVYTGTNRESYADATSAGLMVYNEGTSLPLLYSAADVIVTHPETPYVAAARSTGKLVALLAPRNAMEERNASYLNAVAVNASDVAALDAFLSEYPSEKYEEIRQKGAVAHRADVGAKLAEFII